MGWLCRSVCFPEDVIPAAAAEEVLRATGRACGLRG